MKKINVLGLKIYKQRLKKGLSQVELARRIGVSHSMISHYEKGDKSPQIITLEKIAAVLDVDFNYLFYNNDMTEPEILTLLKSTDIITLSAEALTEKEKDFLKADFNLWARVLKEKYKI